MEYVSKNEIKPYRKQFEEKLLPPIRKECKKNGLTFEHNLVGSAKNNLVVRHHNKGFDCDYQLTLRKNKKNLDPNTIKDYFSKLFKFMIDDLKTRGYRKVTLGVEPNETKNVEIDYKKPDGDDNSELVKTDTYTNNIELCKKLCYMIGKELKNYEF